MNHAQHGNAEVTRPVFVRGKWKIGFMAVSDNDVGDEVVWDYGVRAEVCSGCRLVQGVVRRHRGKQTSDREPCFQPGK